MSRGLRWGVLLTVLALAVGGLVGALLLPPLLPPSAEGVDGPRAVPVTERVFDDAHTVAAVPELSREMSVVLSGPGGMVTASACAPGAVVKAGDHLLSVDGVVRIAVVTEVPLWRDLSFGMEGADVEGLQRALVEQGNELSVSGRYGWDTVAAVEAMQDAARVEPTGRIALDRVQWVPAGVGAVASCEVGVGLAIASGSPVLVAGGTLIGLSLPGAEAELPGRPYVAVAGEVVVAIGEDRRVTDPALMSAVAATTAFAEWVKDPAGGVAVLVRLAEPIAAIGIPPSAVVVSDARTGCVVIGGEQTVAVEVLASELGTVFAVPERPVDRVIVPAAEVTASCE